MYQLKTLISILIIDIHHGIVTHCTWQILQWHKWSWIQFKKCEKDSLYIKMDVRMGVKRISE
jgi:hypothetical protein